MVLYRSRNVLRNEPDEPTPHATFILTIVTIFAFGGTGVALWVLGIVLGIIPPISG